MIKFLTPEMPRPGDLMILALCVALVPASYLAVRQNPNAPTAVRISTPKATDRIYPLQPDRTLKIEGQLGTSVIEVQQGKVRFVASPCDGKHCVLSGWHRHSGSGMACLPNRVAISLVARQEDFDGMNY